MHECKCLPQKTFFKLISLAHRSGDVTISKLKVDGCQRESTWGYIDAESPSYIGIRNVTLNDFHCINNVNTQGASCLSAWSVNGMEIKNMLATNNKGSIGGVLDMAHSKAIIMDSRFESNKAGFSGGVAHFHYSLNLTLQNVNFNSNSAAQGGGAILMQVLTTLNFKCIVLLMTIQRSVDSIVCCFHYAHLQFCPVCRPHFPGCSGILV